MAAPHYCYVTDGSPRPVWHAEAHTTLLSGRWKLWYIPDDDSGYGSARMLVWVKPPGAGDSLFLWITQSSGCKIQLFDSSGLAVEREVTFSAGQRLRIEVNAEAGTLNVQGATTGNGTSGGTPWSGSAGGGEWRVGTSDAGGSPARGYVSLPYAIATDDPLPEDGASDFTDTIDDESDIPIEDESGEDLLVE